MSTHLRRIVISLAAALVVGGASSAMAGPIAPNVRPVTIGWSGEPSLSSILGCLFYGDASCNPETTSLSYDVIANESTAGLWSTAGGEADVTLQFQYSGNRSEIGLWSGFDADGPIAKLKLFDGSARGANNGGPTAASVQFDGNGITVSGTCGLVNCQTDLVGSGIDADAFGFYLTDPGGQSFYTMDARNIANEAHALSFTDGAGLWAVAFEDLRLAYSDRDYNDNVLTIRSSSDPVTPTATPEPATLLLLGTGLAGAMGRRLRRGAKAA